MSAVHKKEREQIVVLYLKTKIATGLELARREGRYTVANCGRIPATIILYFIKNGMIPKKEIEKNSAYWF